MKKIASFVLILLCAITTKAQTNDFSPLQNRLKAHVYYLASDELRGRKGGSEDAAKAAEYIVDQYKQAGLKPLYSNFLVPFSPKNSMYKDMLGEETGAMVDDIMSGAMKDKRFRNVVAVIEGSDNTLKHEFIIIGAHYDHLGVKSDGVVYNGADDNASGSAAIIEVARELMQHPELLKRSVIIAAFDGEEMGLYGSNALANKLFDENDERYRRAWRQAADRLLETGKPFEINTGAISRGYKSVPSPSAEILSYLIRRGARLSLLEI